MKLTREIVLVKWSKEWANLKAYGRDLSKVEIEISDRVCQDRLGTCWTHEQRLVIYPGKSITDDLDTLIHELAHAATIGDAHGELWQKTYASAIEEVTGIPIPKRAGNYHRLCQAGRQAVASWWEASGNAFLWRLCQ